MGETVRPQYGCLRMGNITWISGDIWLEGEEIEAYLGELANMRGRNQLGRQYPSGARGETEDFCDAEEVARCAKWKNK